MFAVFAQQSFHYVQSVQHLNQRCRPSTESRTRNRLRGSFGTGSCRGSRSPLHQFHRRTEGCQTAWRSRDTVRICVPHLNEAIM